MNLKRINNPRTFFFQLQKLIVGVEINQLDNNFQISNT